jgi:hypothetical protein
MYSRRSAAVYFGFDAWESSDVVLRDALLLILTEDLMDVKLLPIGTPMDAEPAIGMPAEGEA